MGKLIDTDKLKKHQFHGCYTNILIASSTESYMLGWDDAIDAIVNKMPKSTTVDLVRCKDCIYRDHRICYAHSAEVYVRGDDYCSRGRRKDDER